MLLNRSQSAILGKDWKVQSQLFSARNGPLTLYSMENSKLWVFFSIKTWICPRNPVSIQELWLFFWTHYFRILWNKMPNTGRHLLKLCLILIFFSDLLPVLRLLLVPFFSTLPLIILFHSTAQQRVRLRCPWRRSSRPKVLDRAKAEEASKAWRNTTKG